MSDEYVSSGEAARRVGISKASLLRAVHRGEIRTAHRTPGGQFRFHPADLAAYGQRLAAAGAAAAPAAFTTATALQAPTDGAPATPTEALTGSLAAGIARLAALPPTAALDRLADDVLALLAESLDAGAVLLAHISGEGLLVERVLDRAGLGLHAGMELPLSAGAGASARLLAPEHPLVVDDSGADPPVAALPLPHVPGVPGSGACSGAPLHHADGRPYGALCILYAEPRVVDATEIALLTLAGRTLMQAVDRDEARAREEHDRHIEQSGRERPPLPGQGLPDDEVTRALPGTTHVLGRGALLVLDLDGLKESDDSFGHGDGDGDRVLQEVATRLRGALRGNDIVVRLGGDEFAVLLAGDDAAGAALAAQRLARAFAAPLMIEGQALPLRPRIGIALFPEHGADPHTLLRRAEVAMDAARRGGRTTVI